MNEHPPVREVDVRHGIPVDGDRVTVAEKDAGRRQRAARWKAREGADLHAGSVRAVDRSPRTLDFDAAIEVSTRAALDGDDALRSLLDGGWTDRRLDTPDVSNARGLGGGDGRYREGQQEREEQSGHCS